MSGEALDVMQEPDPCVTAIFQPHSIKLDEADDMVIIIRVPQFLRCKLYIMKI